MDCNLQDELNLSSPSRCGFLLLLFVLCFCFFVFVRVLSQQQKNHPEYCPDFQPAYKQTTHVNLTVPPQRGHSDSSPGHLMILALQSHRVFSPAHMNPTQPHLFSSAFPITEDLDPLVSTHPYPGVYAPTHVRTQG